MSENENRIFVKTSCATSNRKKFKNYPKLSPKNSSESEDKPIPGESCVIN